jgi:hypothetical protein
MFASCFYKLIYYGTETVQQTNGHLERWLDWWRRVLPVNGDFYFCGPNLATLFSQILHIFKKKNKLFFLKKKLKLFKKVGLPN